jgi:hypothetical protein
MIFPIFLFLLATLVWGADNRVVIESSGSVRNGGGGGRVVITPGVMLTVRLADPGMVIRQITYCKSPHANSEGLTRTSSDLNGCQAPGLTLHTLYPSDHFVVRRPATDRGTLYIDTLGAGLGDYTLDRDHPFDVVVDGEIGGGGGGTETRALMRQVIQFNVPGGGEGEEPLNAPLNAPLNVPLHPIHVIHANPNPPPLPLPAANEKEKTPIITTTTTTTTHHVHPWAAVTIVFVGGLACIAVVAVLMYAGRSPQQWRAWLQRRVRAYAPQSMYTFGSNDLNSIDLEKPDLDRLSLLGRGANEAFKQNLQ